MAIVPKKAVLIMGIANQRSIAWSCMEAFLKKKDWLVIYTVQTNKANSKVQGMLEKNLLHSSCDKRNILGGFSCDVTDPSSMERFFHQELPEMLLQNPSEHHISLHAVVHSLAFASNLKTPLLETTRESFLEAHEVSAYSLIQVARESLPLLLKNETGDGNETLCTKSITTLSYLGAARAIPGYNVMGPAKASLESVVRGLASELGSNSCPIRVNAVRAGPLPTISSKGGIAGFDLMRKDVQAKAPLGNVSAAQVADSIYHVAAEAHGMTGQTIDIDGGYSVVAGPALDSGL
jgi:enoyl-[acyl-carrier protein] reductase I